MTSILDRVRIKNVSNADLLFEGIPFEMNDYVDITDDSLIQELSRNDDFKLALSSGQLEAWDENNVLWEADEALITLTAEKDRLVSIDAADRQGGYLFDKITTDSSISIEKKTIEGVKKVELKANIPSNVDEKSKASANDTTAGFLADKIIAGQNIQLVPNNQGGNETITVNATGDLSGHLPICQLSSADFSLLLPTFTDVNYDSIDIENDTDSVERSVLFSDRIVAKQSGYYLLGYENVLAVNATRQIWARVRKNDAITLQSTQDNYNDTPGVANNYEANLDRQVVVYLEAGDFVSLQMSLDQAATVGEVECKRSVFYLIGLKGSKGEKGDQGPAGDNLISTKDDGTLVGGSPHSTINFGSGLRAVDAGNGQVDVSLENAPGALFGSNFHRASSNSVSTTTRDDVWTQKVELETSSLPAGLYRIGWSYNWNHDSTSADFAARLQLGNSQTLWTHKQEPKESGGTSYEGTGTDQAHTASGFIYLNLTGVNEFDLDFQTTKSGNESSIWNARLELWMVSATSNSTDADTKPGPS